MKSLTTPFDKPAPSVSRREMQPIIDDAVLGALEKAGVDMTPDHKRRMVRSLMHLAARIGQSAGYNPDTFAIQASTVFAEEMPKTHLEAIALMSPFCPTIGRA